MTIRYGSWIIIIDDVVFPDGRTAMNILGGGGLQAAVGMRLWTEDVGILAAVDANFDPAILDLHGLERSGLKITEWPTPRAWQLFEEDGKRTQIWRMPLEGWRQQLAMLRAPETIPTTLQAAHWMGRGDNDDETMTRTLKEAGVRLGAEPIVLENMKPEERDTVLRSLQYIEVFSPDAEGAALLVGPLPVPDQLRALADYGPRIVAMRQGAAGSLLYERDQDRFLKIPAAPATIVDVTGAGNAYGGGLLIGWIETGDAVEAAARAAISAALTIEQVGPPLITPATLADARRRRDEFLPSIQIVDSDAINGASREYTG